MTGPALSALFRWVTSLPSSDAWPGHCEPVEEWPARPAPKGDAGRARVMPPGRREVQQGRDDEETGQEGPSAVAGRANGPETWNGTAQRPSEAHGADEVEVCQ